jgi:hypothetical protein
VNGAEVMSSLGTGGRIWLRLLSFEKFQAKLYQVQSGIFLRLRENWLIKVLALISSSVKRIAKQRKWKRKEGLAKKIHF